MILDWLIEKISEYKNKEALIWRDKSYSYEWILERYNYWKKFIDENNIEPNTVTVLEADYSPNACALMLALIQNNNIFVPLTSSVKHQRDEFINICEAQSIISIDESDNFKITQRNITPKNILTLELINKKNPGLVLFSSGSTGKSKAALHDFSKLIEKFKTPRQSKRMLAFLLFDHIGGINTLLYCLANAGTIVAVSGRNADEICRAIEKHNIQILPTSPTFINLLLISDAYKRYNLSSLELITYGTEVMPESTLKTIANLLPTVKLQQTYGLSELGILRSKSKSSDSLWVKIGGEGFDIKVVDGILWVKAESAMLGYLNAPNPFDNEGWFNTQDEVLIDGEYMKILGRKSEIINVGGEKVYPAEVESVLLQMSGITDAIVLGEKHPITGNIVVAKINIDTKETISQVRKRIREFCKEKLASYKIPVKIYITEEKHFSERYKRMRR